MRFSFCKGLHIAFVKNSCNVTECVHDAMMINVRRQIRSLSGEPAMLIGVHQKPRKIVIWGIKSRKIFWPAGAVSACGGSNSFFLISAHDFALTYSSYDTFVNAFTLERCGHTKRGSPSLTDCVRAKHFAQKVSLGSHNLPRALTLVPACHRGVCGHSPDPIAILVFL